MDFGGPVWHVSVASVNLARRRDVARRFLRGVGDRRLGEWIDDRLKAFHLRRRCSDHERQIVGDPRDIRGTDEEVDRLLKLDRRLPVNHPLKGNLQTASGVIVTASMGSTQ